jgi:MFS family permease
MTKIRALLTPDGWLLFATRSVRMFAYGALSVVLVLYLSARGLGEWQIGWLLTMALLGDTAISLWITTAADRHGRRRMLLLGAMLMALAGIVFSMPVHYFVLLIAASIGVLSPSDKEVGPFLAIEQAALSETVLPTSRTSVFAWYHVVGSLAAALGTLVAGLVAAQFLSTGRAESSAYQPVVIGYALAGVVLAIGFLRLSPRVEASGTGSSPGRRWGGLHRSRGIVLRLSALFALDAFGGGFILQSIVAYWFHVRFGLDPAALGAVLFGANLLAAFSALVAARLARRLGLIRTMVFTHLPSNVILLLIPLMPNATLAVVLLLLRSCISQMDVPTRQSYTLAIVQPDERSAAAGITGVARSIGAALAPTIAGYLLANEALHSAPFFLAGATKIVYDLWLFRAFATIRPDHES